jgi:hypothetical protein
MHFRSANLKELAIQTKMHYLCLHPCFRQLALSHSNITVEVDENTGASTSSASSFELQALSNSQIENALKNLLPDNDGFDDLIKVLDIPQKHQTCFRQLQQ